MTCSYPAVHNADPVLPGALVGSLLPAGRTDSGDVSLKEHRDGIVANAKERHCGPLPAPSFK